MIRMVHAVYYACHKIGKVVISLFGIGMVKLKFEQEGTNGTLEQSFLLLHPAFTGAAYKHL